ncbi:hypothetical protein V3C99_003082 [Haemonchus contortus]|uniref:Uncharacterized protein n=1 Tax=Haemonchus contortus TaxID=6289 RepID=A0A7I5E8F8_HAECO
MSLRLGTTSASRERRLQDSLAYILYQLKMRELVMIWARVEKERRRSIGRRNGVGSLRIALLEASEEDGGRTVERCKLRQLVRTAGLATGPGRRRKEAGIKLER